MMELLSEIKYKEMKVKIQTMLGDKPVDDIEMKMVFIE